MLTWHGRRVAADVEERGGGGGGGHHILLGTVAAEAVAVLAMMAATVWQLNGDSKGICGKLVSGGGYRWSPHVDDVTGARLKRIIERQLIVKITRRLNTVMHTKAP